MTLSKPEWPASGLLMTLLGRTLMINLANKQTSWSLKTTYLEYLGLVAAGLRKIQVTYKESESQVDEVVQRVLKSDMQSKRQLDELQVLQKAFAIFLESRAEVDPALRLSRNFYIADWYCDASVRKPSSVLKEDNSEKKNSIKRKKASRTRTSDVENYNSSEDDAKENVLLTNEEQKQFLLSLIHIKHSETKKISLDYQQGCHILDYLNAKKFQGKRFDTYLKRILVFLREKTIQVRTKALKCLSMIVAADPSVLSQRDTCQGVHARLMDESANVREAAVELIGKYTLSDLDVFESYYDTLIPRLMDTGISVRKKVIGILKAFCLDKPDCPKLPDICAKILFRVKDEDSIRKMVLEVFQAMWFTPTSLNATPDSSKATPQSAKNTPNKATNAQLVQKVITLVRVVQSSKEAVVLFEELLKILFKSKDDGISSNAMEASKEIISCLVEDLLQTESSEGSGPHLVACTTTLLLFSKFCPDFITLHAGTIMSYLSIKCRTEFDEMIVKNVNSILEVIVPLIKEPSSSFLAQIEEDLGKAIYVRPFSVLSSTISCISAIVKISSNHLFIRNMFQMFYPYLKSCKKFSDSEAELKDKVFREKLCRTLYIVGLFTRHFDYADLVGEEQACFVKQKAFDIFISLNHHPSDSIRLVALTSLGFMLVRHHDFMLGHEVSVLYRSILSDDSVSFKLKRQILRNIASFLVEEEKTMIRKDANWVSLSKEENLKEMGDVASGMGSAVIQIYLKDCLECVFHPEEDLRRAVLRVIKLIVAQGLVNPSRLVPYLICLGADDEKTVRNHANQLLADVAKRYPAFLHTEALAGLRMSFKLGQVLRKPGETVRGFLCPDDHPVSRTGFLYSLKRTVVTNRRAFLFSMLKLFDEQVATPLTELLYIADNLAHYPYLTADEPMYIMYQINIVLSVSGSNLLQAFQDCLLKKVAERSSEDEGLVPDQEEEDDDDFDSVLKRLPEDIGPLQRCIVAAQGCILLLYLKQFLKLMYYISDSKIQGYSPSNKIQERSLGRKKEAIRFHPEPVLKCLESEMSTSNLKDSVTELRISTSDSNYSMSEMEISTSNLNSMKEQEISTSEQMRSSKRGSLTSDLENSTSEQKIPTSNDRDQLVRDYLHFKQLMLSVDREDFDDENDEDQPKTVNVITVVPFVAGANSVSASAKTSSAHDNVVKSSSKRSSVVKDKRVKKQKKRRRRIVVDSESDLTDESDPDYE